jgi:hypothetical protein
MKRTISIFSLLIICTAAFAQTDVDAFRFSRGSVTGTARFTGMSGAFGALGGDFSTLSYNPAGIAIYRSSEFTFTPSIYVGKTSSAFLGQSYDERKYNFNFGNVGLVYTRKLSDSQSPGWKSWNFGIGYNRLANFHNRTSYQGLNTENSIVDHFAGQSSGIDPSNLDPYFEGLAYETYLITPDADNIYFGTFPSGQTLYSAATPKCGEPSAKPFFPSEPITHTGFISAPVSALKVCASLKMQLMRNSIRIRQWTISPV